MEIQAVKSVLEELREWVKIASEWSSKNERKEEEALNALLHALNETMIYLGRINAQPGSAYRETEEQIARLWKNAAIKVRPYNKELATRCNAKGLYWGNPSYFTDEEIKKMKISITDIQEYANKALKSV